MSSFSPLSCNNDSLASIGLKNNERPIKSNEQQSEPPRQKKWASLADRLNPNRAAYDPQLKAAWKGMRKIEKKRIIAQDKKAIKALQSRGTSASLPFEADPDDHCETSPVAYSHIAPVLKYIAEKLNKKSADLVIYDPYYCAGAVVEHLNKLGFTKVYNKCEDFYGMSNENKVPNYDVLLTNPPYSGNHFHRLLEFLKTNNKPSLLLLPEHFSRNKSPIYSEEDFCFLIPPARYHYWTPRGMRPDNETGHNEESKVNKCKVTKKKCKKNKSHCNLFLGNRNSPFASHWFLSMTPVVSNESFVVSANDGTVSLAEGCHVYARQASVASYKTFGGAAMRTLKRSVLDKKCNAPDDGAGEKKRKRQRKNKKK